MLEIKSFRSTRLMIESDDTPPSLRLSSGRSEERGGGAVSNTCVLVCHVFWVQHLYAASGRCVSFCRNASAGAYRLAIGENRAAAAEVVDGCGPSPTGIVCSIGQASVEQRCQVKRKQSNTRGFRIRKPDSI
jgi:hypothetical protein